MKKIFITGGTTGIGKSLGEIFAVNGYRVGICGLENLNDLQNLPENFTYYQADVTDEQQIKSAIDKFATENNGIDIVMANAGLNMLKTSIPDTKMGKNVTSVNVFGLINTFSAALPHFTEQQSGHFVAMSSLSALNGLPGMSYYGASKSFVSLFCESLAIDLKEFGISVTCFHPGFIKTSFLDKFNHPMPFILEQNEAAQIIYETIIKKKNHLFFPLIPALFMGLLRRLPRSLYHFIMKRDLLNLKN